MVTIWPFLKRFAGNKIVWPFGHFRPFLNVEENSGKVINLKYEDLEP